MASINNPVRLSESRQPRRPSCSHAPSKRTLVRSRGLPFLFTPIVRYALAHGEGHSTGDTLEARNVPFYERHGFRVVTEGDLPDSAVHVWAMRRG